MSLSNHERMAAAGGRRPKLPDNRHGRGDRLFPISTMNTLLAPGSRGNLDQLGSCRINDGLALHVVQVQGQVIVDGGM